MARKKRLDTESVLSANKSVVLALQAADQADNRYRVALYARLSVEDSGKADGYSIENQISLLEGFIADKDDLVLHKLYVDNGASGVNFERPAFQEMIEDMRAGKINCIIVKDLSRLGRNYLDTGKYIEQIFPFFHVRFISVMDNYDSSRANALDESMLIPLKNIINDYYAKDISKKVASAFEVKQRKGVYLGNYPPYGYLKDPADKGHLVIDENVADIVRQMFQWKADDVSLGQIAERLNERGVPAPYSYFYRIGLLNQERHKDSLWTRTQVKRLLTRRYYIGDMESGKQRSSIITGMKKQDMKKEDWIVVEGTHEPLVSRELFHKVQEKLQESKAVYDSYAGSYKDFDVETFYRGIIRCGNCGGAMKMVRVMRSGNGTKPQKSVEYVCVKYAEHHTGNCKRVKISKKKLDAVVLEELKQHIQMFVDLDACLQKMNSAAESVAVCSEYHREIQKRMNRVAKVENLSSGIYEDYKEGVIDEHEYLDLRRAYASEIATMKADIQKLTEEEKNYKKRFEMQGTCRTVMQRYKGFEQLSRELVTNLIDTITVFEDHRIRITYKFEDEFQRLVNEIIQKKGALSNVG